MSWTALCSTAFSSVPVRRSLRQCRHEQQGTTPLSKTKFLFAAWLILCSVSAAANAQSEPLEAGISVVNITPPRGYRMAGYFSERLNTGEKDPLNAKVIVFRQGNEKVALIFCDLVAMDGPLVERARGQIEKEIGFPASRVVISATHTHTGPLYYGLIRDQLHAAAIEEVGHDPHEKVDYSQQLISAWIKGISEATARLQPVELKHGTGKETRISFNRRFHLKDGSVRFNPGVKNPNIVRPAGPIDPTVDIIRVQSKGNHQDLGAIISFALHLDTVGGTEFSADFPYVLEKEVQKVLGPDAVSLFGTGTCGDINHIDVTADKRQMTADIGRMLGETVNAELPKLAPVAKPALTVARTRYLQDVRKVTPEQIADAQQYFPLGKGKKGSFLEVVEASTVLSLSKFPNSQTEIEITAVALGKDLAIVFLPGEVFVELGMAIKDGSPFQQTLVVELSHSIPAYVPTLRAYQEGSYEVVNSRFVPGGGEVMVEKSLALLKQLAENSH